MSSNVDDTMETQGQRDESPEPETEESAATSGDEGEDADSVAQIASEAIASSPAPPTSGANDPAEDEDVTVSEEQEFVEDGRADRALDFVVEVLTTMAMDCTVDLMENNPDDPPSDIRIEISGKDASRLIGKKGQTLAALQFLTNRVINRPTLPRRHILIDADGYRTRRENALSTMAQKLGKQAVDEGKIITFEPMSAQDRRVVHLALAKFPGVVTKSEGKGASRRVQIIPVRE